MPWCLWHQWLLVTGSRSLISALLVVMHLDRKVEEVDRLACNQITDIIIQQINKLNKRKCKVQPRTGQGCVNTLRFRIYFFCMTNEHKLTQKPYLILLLFGHPLMQIEPYISKGSKRRNRKWKSRLKEETERLRKSSKSLGTMT